MVFSFPCLFLLSHQLHAICNQRVLEHEALYLRNAHKQFEKQRLEKEGSSITPDDQFWKTWQESISLPALITKSWKLGQQKLSETMLREKFPETWDQRERWGSEAPVDDGTFAKRFRVPLSSASGIAEVVGFSLSILKEMSANRGIKYPFSEP